MKKIKWIFLLLAFAGAACMIGIGISVAERSLVGVFSVYHFIYFDNGNWFHEEEKNERKWYALTIFSLQLRS